MSLVTLSFKEHNVCDKYALLNKDSDRVCLAGLYTTCRLWCLYLIVLAAAAAARESRWRGGTLSGVGRFVDKTFRRRIYGRFVDSIINVIPPLRDSSSYYSFHSLGLKYFVFRLVTRHLAAYIVRACRSGSVTWPSRPRERGAGGVKLWAALAPSDPGPRLWRCCSVMYRSVKT